MPIYPQHGCSQRQKKGLSGKYLGKEGSLQTQSNLKNTFIYWLFKYILLRVQLIGVEDDFLSLMDDGGETREDLKIPEGEVGEQIKSAQENDQEILVSLTISLFG